ncbi:MAG: RluA family pseudouridine synthase [Candidatus Pacebacteria bacterium]|nr:RluA family pseudouridine synthase [Candidatus Paceibacterota bacterium]
MKDIPIIYEDDAILAVNKPPGLAVHEDGHTAGPFLTDWVRDTHPGMVGVGEEMYLQNGVKIDRPGVVHRLDRDTSGILLLAKTQEAHAFLKAQFQARMIEKEYRAFVWDSIKEPTGTIDRPIGRSRKDFRIWSSGKDAGGQLRPALTRYSVIDTFVWPVDTNHSPLATRHSFSYVSLSPKTGRTHQLRVHMKAIGHPLVCDTRYAPNRPSALGFTRLALHAYALTFTHPDGTRLILEAPLPEDFVRAQKELQY